VLWAGLDPARPLMRPSLRFRLDPSDAAVVHVIHTDAGHYGETGRLGTADFCVNGGRTQPQCRFSTKGMNDFRSALDLQQET